MNKKGFTFVEMLFVVSFIALLLLIIIPNISGLLKQSDQNKYQSFLNDVFLATEAYIQKNIDDYLVLQEEGGIAYVYMSNLVASHYLNSNVINPNYCDEDNHCNPKKISTCDDNGENCAIDDYTIVVTKGENGVYSYELLKGIISGNYEEPILNGAYPEIRGDLIAVTIENNGEVKRANLKTSWYSYKDKKWANAVILLDKTVTYQEGETIPESNIESYFVWVPRYRYKIFHLGEETSVNTGKPTEGSRAQEIEIIFESKDIAASTGTKIGEYVTHPAYTTMNTNGIWVGKFETGYKGATTEAMAQVNSNDSKQIIVKPNSYSWRGNIVKNMFEAAYNYNRSLESHMMKNTEWGAVAYLSHSKYGINKEININNNSSYLTGYSAVEGTDQTSYPGTTGTDSSVTLPYQTPTGYKASTTGNITGIYDMSGGAWEYMASYMEGTYGSSGFDATSISNYDTKYFDRYPANSTITSYHNRILGDATGEIGSFYHYLDQDGTNRYHNNWYSDYSHFIETSYTWFNRGGNYAYGILASQFSFGRYTGDMVSYLGSRLALVG